MSHPSRGLGDSSINTKISKALCALLRHAIFREGIFMRKDGTIAIRDALAFLNRRRPVSEALLHEVVSTDDKGRFSILRDEIGQFPLGIDHSASGRFGQLWIRANQGHTGEVAAAIDPTLLLTPLTDPTLLARDGVDGCYAYHGTFKEKIPLIRASGGLSRMAIQMIHMAPPLTSDWVSTITPGIRRGTNALVKVNVGKALDAGIPFYVSTNGVIMSPGKEDGKIPLEFLEFE